MKRTLLSFLVCMLTVLIVACSSGATESNPVSTLAATAIASSGDEGKLGNYYVKLLDSAQVKGDKGNPELIIYFEFTNNSDKDISAAGVTYLKAFQNEAKLDLAIGKNSVQESWNYLTKIKPGATIKCAEYFVLNDKSPVSAEMTIVSGSGITLSKTYNVK